MENTILIKRRDEMKQCPMQGCHDGKGSLDWTGVLGDDDLDGRSMNFIHDDILEPGVSIGIHKHTQNEEEYYYILSGKGVMTLNGKEFKVSAGDITAVFQNGEHGLENTGSVPMRIIVICNSCI